MTARGLRILDLPSRRGGVVKLVDHQGKTLHKFVIQKQRGCFQVLAPDHVEVPPSDDSSIADFPSYDLAAGYAIRACERIRHDLAGVGDAVRCQS